MAYYRSKWKYKISLITPILMRKLWYKGIDGNVWQYMQDCFMLF